jgi:tRNA1(Val) A37 N6-methylase TrmN6
VDFGAGAGVGAITLARTARISELVMTDVNPRALAYARANAEVAGLAAVFHQTATLDPLSGTFDLIVANPPFIADSGQAYSDGGDTLGVEATLEWAKSGRRRLGPAGTMVLYSGAPIVRGIDLLKTKLEPWAAQEHLDMAYEEIDPDIFGEELERPTYRTVERIAAVGVVLRC